MKLSNKGYQINSESILLGKVIGVHGVRGIVKVYSYSETLENYNSFDDFALKLPGALEEKIVRVLWIKAHKKIFLFFIKGINRDTAKSIVGWNIYIKKENLPPLEDDTYFWSDLIGIAVKKKDGRDLGYLSSVIRTGVHDVYVIKTIDHLRNLGLKKEILIPAIKSVIVNVDLINRVMYVNLPDGLV